MNPFSPSRWACDADLAQHRAGDDGVLVVAEQFLHLLDLLDQPLRRLAEHRGGGLGRVPQPLGGLAGLVPLACRARPRPRAGRPPDVPGDPAVRPADQGGQLAARSTGGPAGSTAGRPAAGRSRRAARGTGRSPARRSAPCGRRPPARRSTGSAGPGPGRRPARRASSSTAWVNRACSTSRSRASPSTPASHFSSSVSSRVASRSMTFP